MQRSKLLIFTILLILFAGYEAHAMPMPGDSEAPLSEGLVCVSMASLRGAPSHAAEMETQALLGTPVTILGTADDGWLRVRMPDGYEAFAHPQHISRKTPEQMTAWRRSPRLIVTAFQPQTVIADTLAVGARNVVADVSLCCILEGTLTPGARFARVTLPDGRTGFLPAWTLADFHTWANTPPSTQRIVDAAFNLTGVPYLWGGTTRNGVDCSGLTQLSYFSVGILLPRNASQQARVGSDIDFADVDNLAPADLLFFAGSDPQRITHVALYDRDGNFIHSLATVHVNSMIPGSDLYLERPVVRARRIISPDIAGDVTLIASSPLYFLP